MNILEYTDPSFFKDLDKFLRKRNINDIKKIDKIVSKVLLEVKEKGDEAIIKYTKQFDKKKLQSNQFLLSKKKINSYKKQIDKKIFKSFTKAIKNVRKFHKLQLPKNLTLSTSSSPTTSLPFQSEPITITSG